MTNKQSKFKSKKITNVELLRKKDAMALARLIYDIYKEKRIIDSTPGRGDA